MEYNNVKTVCLILNFVCLLLLLSLSYYVSRIGGLKKKGQTDFLVAIYALMALQAVSIGMLLSINAGASMRTFSLIWATISMAILPLLPVLMSIAIGKDFKLFEKITAVIAVLGSVLALSSGFTGFVFNITAENALAHGSLFAVYDLCMAAGLLCLLIETFKANRDAHYRTDRLIVFPFILFLSGCLILMFVPEICTSFGCLTAGTVLYYIYAMESSLSHDPLTGLLNAHAYETDIEIIRKEPYLNIIVLDIDDLAVCNQTYGHPYGDICIRSLADAVKTVFEPIGYCYRSSGDNFVIFCRTYDEKLIKKKSDQFLKTIIEKRNENHHIPMISTGFGVYMKNTESIEKTIDRANEQLRYYQNLRREGKPIVIWEETK